MIDRDPEESVDMPGDVRIEMLYARADPPPHTPFVMLLFLAYKDIQTHARPVETATVCGSGRQTSMSFDLLLLDLDGTLVDSEAILVKMVNDTLVAHGHPPGEPRSVAASIGLPLAEVFRRALPCPADDMLSALCAYYRTRADAGEFVRQFRLYPGVQHTLAALRSTGARLVIATSKGRSTTLDILRHCAIDDLIDDVIGGDCVTHGKPHPEMVHRARERFGTPPEQTMVVGDTSFDIQMGQAAGVATCAVTYGMHPAGVLQALQPDFLIDQFESLRDVVTGPNRL